MRFRDADGPFTSEMKEEGSIGRMVAWRQDGVTIRRKECRLFEGVGGSQDGLRMRSYEKERRLEGIISFEFFQKKRIRMIQSAEEESDASWTQR